MEAIIENQRRFPRIRAKADVDVLITQGTLQELYSCFDISREGFYVLTKDPLPVGTKVRFEIRFKDQVLPYHGAGAVIRTQQYKSKSYPPGMAVLFEKLFQARPRGILLLRRAAEIGRASYNIFKDTIRYVAAEAKGNQVKRELGTPAQGVRKPVLLIHGWLGNRGALSMLENRLKKEGFPVFSIDLGTFNVDKIQKSAKFIAEKIEKLAEKYRFDRIDVIAHSMGGLIGLYYVKKLNGAKRIQRLICIGTPFGGTKWAYAGMLLGLSTFALSLGQMRPGSQFLKELLSGAMPVETEIVCLAASEDILVSPNSALLAQAKNYLLPRGHAALVVSEQIYRFLSALLKGEDPMTACESTPSWRKFRKRR